MGGAAFGAGRPIGIRIPIDQDYSATDRMLQIASIIEREIERYGSKVTILGRSSSGSEQYGHHFGHSAIGIRKEQGHWFVRHLYIDEPPNQLPQVELAETGFGTYLLDSGYFDEGYVFALLIPEPQASRLIARANDNQRALDVLGTHYNAIAYPFSTSHQNCNQWVLELFAASAASDSTAPADRSSAQNWLAAQGYEPSVLEVSPIKRWFGRRWVEANPGWLTDDDHPASDVEQRRYRFSMPTSVAAFVKKTAPGTQRLDFCYSTDYVVIRQSNYVFHPGCVPGEGDRIIPLDR